MIIIPIRNDVILYVCTAQSEGSHVAFTEEFVYIKYR